MRYITQKTRSEHTGTEFIEIDSESATLYSLDTAQKVKDMMRQDTKGHVTFRSAVSREKVKAGTCVTFDTRWFHRGPSGIGYDEEEVIERVERRERERLEEHQKRSSKAPLSDEKKEQLINKAIESIDFEKERTAFRKQKFNDNNFWRIILHMNWKKKRKEGDGDGDGDSDGDGDGDGKEKNEEVFAPPNFLFDKFSESSKWLKGRRVERSDYE